MLTKSIHARFLARTATAWWGCRLGICGLIEKHAGQAWQPPAGKKFALAPVQFASTDASHCTDCHRMNNVSGCPLTTEASGPFTTANWTLYSGLVPTNTQGAEAQRRFQRVSSEIRSGLENA